MVKVMFLLRDFSDNSLGRKFSLVSRVPCKDEKVSFIKPEGCNIFVPPFLVTDVIHVSDPTPDEWVATVYLLDAESSSALSHLFYQDMEKYGWKKF